MALLCVYLVNFVHAYVWNLVGWATGLSAGEGEWASEFSFFNVVIDLTDAGQGEFLFPYTSSLISYDVLIFF